MVTRPGSLFRRAANLTPSFLTVFLAVAGVYFLIQPVEFLTTDGAVREMIARNLLFEGDLALVQVEEGGFYNNLWSIGRDGRPYTYFGLGQSLMLLPFLALIEGLEAIGVARHLAPSHAIPVMAVMLISSALICAFIFGIVRQLGYRRTTALQVTALVAFASILWGLSRQSYDMVQEATGVIGALYFVIVAQKSQGRPRWIACAAAGLLYAAALITRASAAAAAPALALLVLGSKEWGSWREMLKATLWCAAGGLALAWIVPAYNLLRFENILTFGYSGHAPYAGGPIFPGLALWLFSPWQGTLVYMPLLLALPLAWRRFGRRHAHLLAVFATLFVTYLVFHAQFIGLGAYGWGPYYLLPGILPLYVLFAGLFEGWRQTARWQRIVAVALIALTVAVQLPALTVPTERYQSYMVVASPGLSKDALSWSVRWSPLRMQAEGTLTAWGNLPRWPDYIYSPSAYDAATLIDELYAYNVPDWWWLYRVLHGSQLSLAVPLIAALCAAWLVANLVRRPREAPAVPDAGGDLRDSGQVSPAA